MFSPNYGGLNRERSRRLIETVTAESAPQIGARSGIPGSAIEGRFLLSAGGDFQPTIRWCSLWSLNFVNKRRNVKNFSEASIRAHFSIGDISVRSSLELHDRSHHNPALRIWREPKSLLRLILHPDSASSTPLFGEIRCRAAGRLRKQLSTTADAGSRAPNPELSPGRCIQDEIRSHFYWRRRLFSCVRRGACAVRSRDWPICAEPTRVSLPH